MCDATHVGPTGFPFRTSLDSEDLKMQERSPAKPADYGEDLRIAFSFRHSGWCSDRQRVADAINRVFPSSTRARRFHFCGSSAYVCRSEQDPDRYRVVSEQCHDRFCRPCAQARGRIIGMNIANHLGKRPYRFLTLTIKSSGLTLREGINKLYRCFGALRRTKLWQQRVTGGCAVCEVKPGTTHDGWHPHLHCIVEGKYIPQQALKAAWLTITGDSFIVDVSFGRDADTAGAYVTKYITKPFHSDVIRSETKLDEAIQALHGRRVLATFGDWRGCKLTEFNTEEEWRIVCTLTELKRAVDHGDDEAKAIWDSLLRLPVDEHLPLPRGRPKPQTQTILPF